MWTPTQQQAVRSTAGRQRATQGCRGCAAPPAGRPCCSGSLFPAVCLVRTLPALLLLLSASLHTSRLMQAQTSGWAGAARCISGRAGSGGVRRLGGQGQDAACGARQPRDAVAKAGAAHRSAGSAVGMQGGALPLCRKKAGVAAVFGGGPSREGCALPGRHREQWQQCCRAALGQVGLSRPRGKKTQKGRTKVVAGFIGGRHSARGVKKGARGSGGMRRPQAWYT